MRRSSYKWLMPICTFIIFAFTVFSCSKGGDSPTPPTPTEADLVVTTTPTVNSNQAPAALGTGLPVTVTISSSTLPTAGVKIDITARLETSTTNFFTGGTPKSTTASNSFTVTGIPTGGQACLCTITVTSLSKATNIWSGSFKFANK